MSCLFIFFRKLFVFLDCEAGNGRLFNKLQRLSKNVRNLNNILSKSVYIVFCSSYYHFSPKHSSSFCFKCSPVNKLTVSRAFFLPSRGILSTHCSLVNKLRVHVSQTFSYLLRDNSVNTLHSSQRKCTLLQNLVFISLNGHQIIALDMS